MLVRSYPRISRAMSKAAETLPQAAYLPQTEVLRRVTEVVKSFK